MAARPLILSDADEARVRQDVVSSAHRAFDARGFGVRTFPGFLAECISKRVWEHERVLEGGGVQAPVPFVDFVTKPYPVGLGAELADIDAVVSGNKDLATEWERLTGRSVGPRLVPLSKIRRDGGTQVRAELSGATISDYASDIESLPPVDVFDDGAEIWLGDGFHRCAAFESLSLPDVPCIVRPGTRRDAVLFAVGANAKHGLRRSNADKRHAVEMLLSDEEWSRRSDRWLAEQCGVSPDTVGRIRREQLSESDSSNVDVSRTGRDGKTRRAPIPAPEPDPPSEPRRRIVDRDAETQPLAFDGDLGPAEEVPRISSLVVEAFRLVERMTPDELLDFDRQIRPLIQAAENA